MTTQLVPSEIIATWTVPRGRVLYRPREELLMLLRKVKYVLVLPAPMVAQFHQRENRRDLLPLPEGGLKCRSLQLQEQMFRCHRQHHRFPHRCRLLLQQPPPA